MLRFSYYLTYHLFISFFKTSIITDLEENGSFLKNEFV